MQAIVCTIILQVRHSHFQEVIAIFVLKSRTRTSSGEWDFQKVENDEAWALALTPASGPSILLSTLPLLTIHQDPPSQLTVAVIHHEHTGCLPTSGRVRELCDLILQRQGRAPQKETKQKQRSKERKKNYQRGWKGEKSQKPGHAKGRQASESQGPILSKFRFHWDTI